MWTKMSRTPVWQRTWSSFPKSPCLPQKRGSSFLLLGGIEVRWDQVRADLAGSGDLGSYFPVISRGPLNMGAGHCSNISQPLW